MKRFLCGIAMVFAIILLPAQPSYAQGDPVRTEALDTLFGELETLRARSAAKSAEARQLELTKVTMTADKEKLDLLEVTIRPGSALHHAVTNSRTEMRSAQTKAAAPGATKADEEDAEAKEAAFVAATNALNTAKTEADLKRRVFKEAYGVEPEGYETAQNSLMVQIFTGIDQRDAIDAHITSLTDQVRRVDIEVDMALLESSKREEASEEQQTRLLEQIHHGQKEVQQAHTDGLAVLGTKVDGLAQANAQGLATLGSKIDNVNAAVTTSAQEALLVQKESVQANKEGFATVGSKIDGVSAAVTAQTQMQREHAERLIAEIVALRSGVEANAMINAESLASVNRIVAQADLALDRYAENSTKLDEIIVRLTQILDRLKASCAPAPVVVQPPAPVHYVEPAPPICYPQYR